MAILENYLILYEEEGALGLGNTLLRSWLLKAAATQPQGLHKEGIWKGSLFE